MFSNNYNKPQAEDIGLKLPEKIDYSISSNLLNMIFFYQQCEKRGVVAQSVERATPGEEVPGSIPAVASRSLLVGSVSV